MIKIVPVGGIGEIGMNMLLVSSGKEQILVDCGVLFPPFSNLGLEVVLPDYSDFFNKYGEVKKIFVTHGHEDHIGGIPYLLRERNVGICATKYAAEVIKSKIGKHPGLKPKIEVADFDKEISIADFKLRYMRVDHSIPDSACLFIKLNDLNILYAADFRLNGEYTPGFIKAVSKLVEKHKIDVLFSDSTNSDDFTDSISEREVMNSLDKYFSEAKGKIIVTMFSSNVTRINQVISLSKKYKKKLFVSGSNLKNHINIARSLGYLESDDGILRPEKEILKTRDEDTVFLCTGSQAERYSSISRLAEDAHNLIRVEKGDLVIFSSSQIPGNEKLIMNVINKLSEKGADIVYSADFGVHCSGHANREELKKLISLVKPRFFVPIHGEHIHLASHINIALEEGLSPENCFILKSGDELIYDNKKMTINNADKVRRHYIDYLTGDFIGDDTVLERMKMSQNGIVFVNVLLKGHAYKVKILTHGMFTGLNSLLIGLEKEIAELCFKKKIKLRDNVDDIRSLMKRFFRKKYGNYPEIVIDVTS